MDGKHVKSSEGATVTLNGNSAPMMNDAHSDKTPWLLGCFCLLIPLVPQNAVFPGPLRGNGSPARLLVIVLFGLAILGFFANRRLMPGRRINPGAVIILAYFGIWLCLYGTGLLHADRFPGWTLVEANRTRALITLVGHAGLALYVVATVRTFRQRSILLGCLTTGLVAANLIGLLQALNIANWRLLFTPSWFVTNVDDIRDLERLGVSRVMGTAQHPIEFSVLAAITIPLTIYFMRSSNSRNGRILAAVGCVISLLAMPAAVSRSGLVSLFAALLVYMFAFKVRQILLAVLTASVAVLLYSALFPARASALWSTVTGAAEDASIRARTEDYAYVGDIFRAHPFLGEGLGAGPTLFDNQWLQVIVQGGVLGVVAMLMLTGGVIFGIAASLRRAKSRVEHEQAYLLGAVACGILVASTTFDEFFYQQVTFVLLIVFGMMWGSFNVDSPEPQRFGQSMKAAWRAASDKLRL